MSTIYSSKNPMIVSADSGDKKSTLRDLSRTTINIVDEHGISNTYSKPDQKTIESIIQGFMDDQEMSSYILNYANQSGFLLSGSQQIQSMVTDKCLNDDIGVVEPVVELRSITFKKTSNGGIQVIESFDLQEVYSREQRKSISRSKPIANIMAISN